MFVVMLRLFFLGVSLLSFFLAHVVVLHLASFCISWWWFLMSLCLCSSLFLWFVSLSGDGLHLVVILLYLFVIMLHLFFPGVCVSLVILWLI